MSHNQILSCRDPELGRVLPSLQETLFAEAVVSLLSQSAYPYLLGSCSALDTLLSLAPLS